MRVTNLIEGTFILILVFLVLNNAFGFSSILSTFSGAYVSGVKALQGRCSMFPFVPWPFVPSGITANWQTNQAPVVALARNLASGDSESAGKLGLRPLFDMWTPDAPTVQLGISPLVKKAAAAGFPAIHRGEVYTL